MTGCWDDRVNSFWTAADGGQPEAMLADMKALVAERGWDDPDALFELASVHDFLGREAEAVPLYRAALGRGLSGARQPQAVVQLASSLRNVGEPDAAVELLQQHPINPVTGAASQAFLALARRDVGRSDAALRVALQALALTLPLYGTAISGYAEELESDHC